MKTRRPDDATPQRTTRTIRSIDLMPAHGHQRVKVTEKKVTLPYLRFLDDPDSDIPPRARRR